jgi:hypothetical protein
MVVGEHLHPESRKLLDLPVYERLSYIDKGLWINYLAAQQALDRLEELFALPQNHRMPNMLIIGPTNNGKSMIKEKFCKIYRDTAVRRNNDQSGRRELIEQLVVSIQMPAYPTFKTLLLAIAEGIEQADQNDYLGVPQLNQTLYRMLRGIRVKMLIIDELHNMLASSQRQQLEFLNFLRHIGNALQIPLVCLGTKDAYLAISSDPQLENRFEPFLLPCWQEGVEFNNLLESFVAVLPLEYYSDLTDPKIVDWLLVHSGGILGELANILKLATKRAIRLAKEKIDLEILKQLNYKSPKERTKAFETMLSK